MKKNLSLSSFDFLTSCFIVLIVFWSNPNQPLVTIATDGETILISAPGRDDPGYNHQGMGCGIQPRDDCIGRVVVMIPNEHSGSNPYLGNMLQPGNWVAPVPSHETSLRQLPGNLTFWQNIQRITHLPSDEKSDRNNSLVLYIVKNEAKEEDVYVCSYPGKTWPEEQPGRMVATFSCQYDPSISN